MKTTDDLTAKTENENYDYLRQCSPKKLNAIGFLIYIAVVVTNKIFIYVMLMAISSSPWVALDYYYDLFPTISPLTVATILFIVYPIIYLFIPKNLNNFHYEILNLKAVYVRLKKERSAKS